MAEAHLPIVERRLATATKRGVEAAGGVESCRAETGRSIGHLSRCGSVNYTDSITLRDAVRVDRLGAGVAGHPEILNGYASAVGAVVVMLASYAGDDDCLRESVCALTGELGDVARKVNDAVCATGEGGRQVTPREAEAALAELGGMERVTARLRHQLERIAEQPP